MKVNHILSTLFSGLIVVVAAVDISEITGSNLSFEELSSSADGNVLAIDDLNALPTRATGINSDVSNLAAGLTSALQNGQGTPTATDVGTEQDIVDTFTAFSDALDNFAHDLAQKVTPLTIGLQKKNIHDNLVTLEAAFNEWAVFNEGLVADQPYKAGIDSATSNADGAITEAIDAFN